MTIKSLIKLYQECQSLQGTTLLIFIKHIFYRIIYKKKLFVSDNTVIKGIQNIKSSHPVFIGTSYVGFVNNKDITQINIGGKLILNSPYDFGKGCRIDIGGGGIVEIGKGGYVNAYTKIIIMNKLKIGNDCVISWDVQFLDEDFHQISYKSKSHRSKDIIIEDKVWIGCGAKIYQGTVIPKGCVIASDSVVRGIFLKENCIIAGNPAKIIKENIEWQ
ncbi:acyltransferase [Chryseobacterium caseinilyticum]|uniref:Acyltransferase n=1 Tax=Chryseobacterium caseinilyticum TaxID=2771428 RepID=A0ABR8ZG74_9FLAO|nr:acyltransferase [Chryseobacterium caseinilyticum]MBD8084303.1 acyltransferase [Chryseobacterium caseinilyticum]